MKVYCNDCKFECFTGTSRPLSSHLHFCRRKRIYNKFINEWIGKLKSDFKPNERGNCKYYDRKWWKFWVKGGVR